MEKRLQRAKEDLARTVGKSKRPVTSVEDDVETVVDLTKGLDLVCVEPVKRPQHKKEFVLKGVVIKKEDDSESEWVDDEDDE